MLDDGAITGGLTVEGSSFYVRTQRYYSDPARVQKMSINDCTSQGVIEFGTAWTCYQDSYTWSRALLTQINRGVFFRPFGCQDFRSYDLDRGTADPIFVEVRSGSKTLEARNITSVSAHDSTLWLTSHSDELWKLSESGAPIGWANLPTEEYPDLEDTLGSATPDKDHLILVALKGSTLKRFYFDLSHF
jgi:hypothetical protein